jgi:Protein of unknown function (DUF3826)
MKKTSTLFIAIVAITVAFSAAARAAEDNDSTTQPASFEKSAGDRADSVVKSLKIDDPARATRVHDAIATELIAIHQWHQDNDARIKELGKNGGEELDKIQAQRHALHDGFIAKLSAELSPDQMETVKEKLTGGQMMATYRNYPEIIPNLSDEEKAKILETLKEGREEAMDAANRKDRIAIFKKYKGRVNIYLDARGHHVAQAYKDWGKAQKAKQSATTEPAKDAGE